jgi:Tfp pilus assembly protein PilN
MKAVNLIPEQERRGGGGVAGKSGGAVYVALGVLTSLVVVVAAWAALSNTISDRRDEAAQLRREGAAAQAKAQNLAPYKQFGELSRSRVDTVTKLVKGRFDWAHAMREVSRVVPVNAWLTSIVGTVSPGVSVEGGSGSATTLRGAVPNPAIEVVGCTRDQAEVAKLLARLRSIDGVERVSLGSSEKADNAGGAGAGAAAAGGGTGGDCRQGSDRFPKFSVVVFYRAQEGLISPAVAGAQPTQKQAVQAANGDKAGSK